MRILYCGITYPPDVNGQAIFTQTLAQGMVAHGHDVMVLTSTVSSGQGTGTNPGIKIVQVRSIRLTRIHQDLYISVFSRSLIQSIFDQFQPELVHIQDPSPLCQAVLREARRRKIPVIITHHPGPEITSPYIRSKNPVIKWVLYWVGWKFLLAHLNQGNLVVVPSRYSTQMLVNHGVQSDIRIIGCGVQLENFQPNPDLDRHAIRQQYGLDINKTLFLYVGRLDYEKNLDTLIRAIAALDRTDIQLAIVGHGKERADLQNLAAEVGLSQQVVFIGPVAHCDIPDLLNSSDVFIMPGEAESFSIATLEAMACAKPVLAAKAAALPELVAHQVNGYLFQPDRPEDAAAYIEQLADHVEERERMGASSLARAHRYSMVKMVRSYEQAYNFCRQTINNNVKEKSLLVEVAGTPTKLMYKSRRVVVPRIMVALLLMILTLLFSPLIYDQAQARPNLQVTDLMRLDLPPAQRLLVIAPHPDDEVLVAGGLMQNVLENEGEVEVVMVTNGDGQYLSPWLIHPWSILRDTDYVNLGVHRQNETLAALGQIGVTQDRVIFLGYPDGKLSELWARDWLNVTPTVASYTHANISPYKNTYNLQASYRGDDLFNDLFSILLDFQPDIIVVPHPEDTHPDHASVSAFTQFAIARYLASESRTPPKILAYLVHYEGYPIPRGDYASKYLLPPAALANHGEGWMTYSLRPEERDGKKAALNEYNSQLRILGGYLRSFIRANEIFYELPALEMQFAGYKSEAVLEDNIQSDFILSEPLKERASRFVFSDADLVSWRAMRLDDLICFGGEIRGAASKYFQYTLLVKLPDGSNLHISQADGMTWLTKQHFGTCFNLEELGNPVAIGFSAETRSGTILIDQTAWHFVYFPDY